jgi:hypothetical protein
MTDHTEATEANEAPGWDRRRFIKASAGGAALVWAAPTITGLNARAMAAPGSDPDCVAFFTNFDEATPGLSETGTIATGVTVTQGNIDIIPSGGQYDFIPGNGLYLDLDGTSSPVPPQIQVNSVPAGTYSVDIYYAGSRRDDPNSATVTYGSLNGLISLPAGAGPVHQTFNGVTVTASDKLTITQVENPDNQGLLILSIKIYSC